MPQKGDNLQIFLLFFQGGILGIKFNSNSAKSFCQFGCDIL